jgi:hypothetical protein
MKHGWEARKKGNASFEGGSGKSLSGKLGGLGFLVHKWG